MNGPPADAMKRGFFGLVRAAVPALDYLGHYRAWVVAQSDEGSTVDVEPEDKRLPPMSKVPLRVGIPGAKLKISRKPGAQPTYVFIGWENGNPQFPFAMMFDQGSATLSLSITAEKIELGGEGLVAALDGVVRAETPCQFTGAPHLVGGKTSTLVLVKK